MIDLDHLRPEVREAINRQDRQKKCDEYCPVCEDRATIRAELLRLAMIESDALIALDCEHDWQVEHERAEKAEAELAAAQNTIDAQQDTMGALKRKLALSEGELEALKARIAGSSVVKIANYGDPFIVLPDHLTVPNSLKGKSVYLLMKE